MQVKVGRKQPGYTVVSVLDNGRGFDIRQKGKKRTGLGIITQTLAVVNEHNRHKMTSRCRTGRQKMAAWQDAWRRYAYPMAS